jgi:hypothetical protein
LIGLGLVAITSVLVLGGCGGDDGPDEQSAAATTSPAGSTSTGSVGSGSDPEGSGEHPCATVTEEQFAAMMGPDLAMGEPAGSSTNCTLGAAGASAGQSFSFQNLTATGLATGFDEAVGNLAPCSGEAEAVTDVGDGAVVDVSCLQQAGKATLLVEDGGEVLGFYLNNGMAEGVDPASVKETLIEVAARSLGG